MSSISTLRKINPLDPSFCLYNQGKLDIVHKLSYFIYINFIIKGLRMYIKYSLAILLSHANSRCVYIKFTQCNFNVIKLLSECAGYKACGKRHLYLK